MAVLLWARLLFLLLLAGVLGLHLWTAYRSSEGQQR
jgi:hypothetical protein